MVWQQIVIIAYLALCAISNILLIGKPRTPVKPSDSVVTLIGVIGLVILVISI